MSEQRIPSADGTTIGWEVTGSGPPLVLVHGTTADRMRWATVLDPLAERFTVHAVDRRGRGLSGDADAYAIEREFADVAAVVSALDGPVNLLGHSYGAVCSLEAALLTPNLGKLILYEPPLPVGVEIATDEVLARVDEHVAGGEPEEALVTFLTEVVRMPPEQLERMRSLPQWQRRVSIAHTLTREQRLESSYRPALERFEAVEVPTLLMVGTESPPFLTEPVAILEKILPKARVVELQGQAHVAMDTAPDLFVGEVLRFLE